VRAAPLLKPVEDCVVLAAPTFELVEDRGVVLTAAEFKVVDA
jgi:hypothetical protein